MNLSTAHVERHILDAQCFRTLLVTGLLSLLHHQSFLCTRFTSPPQPTKAPPGRRKRRGVEMDKGRTRRCDDGGKESGEAAAIMQRRRRRRHYDELLRRTTRRLLPALPQLLQLHKAEMEESRKGLETMTIWMSIEHWHFTLIIEIYACKSPRKINFELQRSAVQLPSGSWKCHRCCTLTRPTFVWDFLI
jgi:hypothetical protein